MTEANNKNKEELMTVTTYDYDSCTRYLQCLFFPKTFNFRSLKLKFKNLQNPFQVSAYYIFSMFSYFYVQ